MKHTSSPSPAMRGTKITCLLTLLAAATLMPLASNAAARESTIVFDKPGKIWEAEALPIGNGRIGAMLFGGISTDRIQFNENSLWTGDLNVSGGYDESGRDVPNIIGSYQNFGDVFVSFDEADSPLATGTNDVKSGGGFGDALAASQAGKSTTSIPGYRRELNLSTARCTTDFPLDGVNYHREAFASAADEVIVVRYSANKPGQHSGVIRLKPGRGAPVIAKDATLSAPGKLVNGIEYESRVRVVNQGGKITVKDDTIVFSGCDSLTLIIGARTNYTPDISKKWIGDAPGPKLDADMKAAGKSYQALSQAAEQAHRKYMDRVTLDIGSTPDDIRAMSTAARLDAYRKGGADPDLEEDLYNFNRYLLIGSSRNALPANLQGLWNDTNRPAWNCDYHTNINIQMNYWAAESTNLPEMHVPLVNYILAQAPGCRDAVLKDKRQFPKPVRGWTARTSQNIFGGNGWDWNIPSSAWYMQHVWDHYAFTRDKDYLRDVAYPAMKDICNFWEDNLKELTADGANFATNDTNADRSSLKGIKAGTLVAPNGWSPEHGPREDGVAHDQQIIWDLFTNTAEAARELGEKDYADKLTKLAERLDGPRIGKWGQLQEWMIDRDGANDTHRHTSPLYAVYPGHQITSQGTPELATAALKLLKARSNDKGDKPFKPETTIGDSRRSWTWPWRCALWARLGEGDRAGTMVRGLLSFNTLDNLFTTHPPFQIDGNLGIGGGVTEMLLQSHADEIHLIPALSKEWANGSVSGLRARGGFTVDIAWQNGKVTTAKILSAAGEPIRLRAGTSVTVSVNGAPVSVEEKNGILSFATKAGATYTITAKS